MGEPVTPNQRVILLAYGDDLFVYSVAQRDQAYQVYAVVEVTGLQVTIGETPELKWPSTRKVIEEAVPTLRVHYMREAAG